MFDRSGEASFMLFGCCKVTYHNETGKNTYGADGAKIQRLELYDETKNIMVESGVVSGELARSIREGKISRIDAYLA